MKELLKDFQQQITLVVIFLYINLKYCYNNYNNLMLHFFIHISKTKHHSIQHNFNHNPSFTLISFQCLFRLLVLVRSSLCCFFVELSVSSSSSSKVNPSNSPLLTFTNT